MDITENSGRQVGLTLARLMDDAEKAGWKVGRNILCPACVAAGRKPS
ncbi:MAG: hypothetical protein NUW01_09675 [Gemmatimonadaceae bacterium]|nr:hypothetical protein [Gemmatimonadaceae bacterium]